MFYPSFFSKKYFSLCKESEPLLSTLATDAIIGASLSPACPGSGYVLLHHVMGESEGVKGAWAYVEGGIFIFSYPLLSFFFLFSVLVIVFVRVFQKCNHVIRYVDLPFLTLLIFLHHFSSRIFPIHLRQRFQFDCDFVPLFLLLKHMAL